MSVGAWRIFMVDPPYERGIVEIAPRDIWVTARGKRMLG